MDALKNIEYRKINEVPGWYATVDGRIYSERAGRFLTGRVLKGYIQVGTLKDQKKSNGVKLYRAHRLICRAFHGDPPNESYTVDHIDFNKLNNRPDNLRWATVQENISHSVNSGRRLKKLTPEAIQKIREEYCAWDRTKSGSVIARKYGVHRSTIFTVVSDTYKKYINEQVN